MYFSVFNSRAFPDGVSVSGRNSDRGSSAGCQRVGLWGSFGYGYSGCNPPRGPDSTCTTHACVRYPRERPWCAGYARSLVEPPSGEAP